MTGILCPHCGTKTRLEVQARFQQGRHHYCIRQCIECNEVVYATSDQDTLDDPFTMYPTLRADAAPEYPDNVRENFTEAIRSINGANYKAAVIMTRSALQAATRALGASGKDLKSEIDDLANKNLIPDSLREWAHNIRDGGNLVAHPEPEKHVGKEDADELVALAESIFEYLYVIPARVAARRARLSQPP